MIVGRTINYNRLRNPVAAHRTFDRATRLLIAQLFGNGEQGLIWLPRPTVLGEQALWQQSDGTVIVNADGDPIGRGEDVSGNDNDLTQPVSADRPLYRTDGTLNWAQFDGAGDHLVSGRQLPLSGDFTLGIRLTMENVEGSIESVIASQYLVRDAGRLLVRGNPMGSSPGNVDFIVGGPSSSMLPLANGEAATLILKRTGNLFELKKVGGATVSLSSSASLTDVPLKIFNGPVGSVLGDVSGLAFVEVSLGDTKERQLTDYLGGL